MAADVTPVFAEYFGRNRGPDPADPDRRQAPDYGVAASLEGSVVKLRLTFRCSRAYCCYDAGCHIGLPDGCRWNWLRRSLSDRGIAAPSQMELRMEVVVEEGAIFFDMFKPDPTRRNWYAFSPVAANEYRHSASEGPVSAESIPAPDPGCSV